MKIIAFSLLLTMTTISLLAAHLSQQTFKNSLSDCALTSIELQDRKLSITRWASMDLHCKGLIITYAFSITDSTTNTTFRPIHAQSKNIIAPNYSSNSGLSATQ